MPGLFTRALVAVLLTFPCIAAQAEVPEVIEVAPVWAGHPVGFDLLTHKQKQFVAFYDAQRCMTIASRPLDSTTWTFQVLGSQIYNVYDLKSRAWRRLLDRPLTDGEGEVSAYLHGPVRGPDRYFHLAWVWRDTPDCATNHSPSYARSHDLRHWERSDGTAINLPITRSTGEVIDPVPADGGIINGNVVIGFDSERRMIVSYHKFDEAGATQLYNARLEDGKWVVRQASDWSYRWAFSGGGSIQFEVRVSPVQLKADGTLTQAFSHAKHGSGVWTLDPQTLKPTATNPPPPSARPASLEQPESDFPGIAVKWHTSGRYHLRWETLPSHRDRPRERPWPEASMLRVYVFASKTLPVR